MAALPLAVGTESLQNNTHTSFENLEQAANMHGTVSFEILFAADNIDAAPPVKLKHENEKR